MTFKVLMKIFFGLCLLVSFKISAQEVSTDLYAETWDTQRHGEVLLKLPELKKVVEQWSKNSSNSIELRYPGGEEGELWVEELKDWFVSLGVPSTAIQASPESKAQDIINIVIIKSVK